MLRRYRIVVAKPGLDGHDRGAKVIARSLRDAGFEVIYTGLHQTPEQVVEAVVQEDADALGLSLLSGAHMTLVPRITTLLGERGADDVLLMCGGIIPDADIAKLKEAGVAQVFTPGASLSGIAGWLEEALDARGAGGKLMDLLEYQGKQYLARFGVAVSVGGVADTVEAAVAEAEANGYPVVVKAQVHIGGRGKAGGIKVAANAGEVREAAVAILGMDIRGHVVRRLWVERAVDLDQEWYASFTLDRSARLHLGLLSAEGGMDIEQVAVERPSALARLHVDPVEGLGDQACAEWVAAAGLPGAVVPVLAGLYRCFVDGDADLVEVNPLVLTSAGQVLALDAKVTLDDNAAFRHPEWDEFRGLEVLDDRERLARSKGLQYIGLDGTVGIIANGAGLAMSTLDVVNQVGGSAANFLDVGGGASAAVMANALEVIASDERVRAVFVNIFGGITRGDEIARGIVDAMGRVDLPAPLVVRIDGTNAEEGRAILAAHESDRLVNCSTMLEAAREAVRLAAPGTPPGATQ